MALTTAPDTLFIAFDESLCEKPIVIDVTVPTSVYMSVCLSRPCIVC